jgi:hypothetical protein
VDQAVDDLGRSLADEEFRKSYAGLRGMEGYARREVESHRTVYFFNQFPSADATTLTRVKGGALINIALEDLALEYLISDVGAKRDLGQYTLEFTDFKAEKSRANSRFTLSRLDHTALESVPMGPIDSTNFELLDRDGKPFRWSSHGPRLKDGKCIYEKSWTIEEGRVPTKIRLRYLSRSRLYEIPFEFANVSLPP